eukprot:gene27696-20508_t
MELITGILPLLISFAAADSQRQLGCGGPGSSGWWHEPAEQPYWPGFREVCVFKATSYDAGVDEYRLLSPPGTYRRGDVNKTTASSLLDVLEWVDEGWPSDGYGGDATESISLFDHPKHATAMFTTDGRRLEDNDAFQKAVKAATDTVGVAVFAYQNGQWIWPGVRIGYEREVVASDGISFTMQTLSLRPTVVSLGQFLSPAESAHIHDLVRDLCPTQSPCSQ